MAHPFSISEAAPTASTARTAPRSAPFRLGLVGCGAVAERYHLPAILSSTAVRLAMFADPVLERAERFRSYAPAAAAVADHGALPGQVDLAIVAVPTPWHARVAADLLRAGVHVLLEKPMGLNAGECERLRSAARQGQAVLAIGHDFRFFPVAQAAHRLLSSRLLGPILDVDVRQSAGTRWPCLSPATLAPGSGGGVLLHFGIHTLDLLLWWLGDLVPLSYADDACGGVEAECESELLQVRDRFPVHLEVSRRRTLRDTTIVRCSGGTIEIGIYEPAVLRLTLAPDAPPLEAQAPDPEFEQAPLRTVFQRQLAEFVAAVVEGRAPLVDADAGGRAVALVDASYALRRPLRRAWDFPDAYRTIPEVGR